MRCQKKKKKDAVEHFGGKCVLCDYGKCLSAMEFHHLDKSEKEEEPTYVIMRWSWERAKKELEKCILVCCRCHREIHSENFDQSIDLQIHVRPWIDVECKRCGNKFSTKDYRRQYCSTTCWQIDSRKVARPTKNDLKVLLTKNVPWVKLGKMFNVSDNAVRKWARQYKLLK